MQASWLSRDVFAVRATLLPETSTRFRYNLASSARLISRENLYKVSEFWAAFLSQDCGSKLLLSKLKIVSARTPEVEALAASISLARVDSIKASTLSVSPSLSLRSLACKTNVRVLIIALHRPSQQQQTQQQQQQQRRRGRQRVCFADNIHTN